MIYVFFLDLLIGNMVKSQIYISMQEYLSDELAKCKVNTKISTIPISVSIETNFKKINKKIYVFLYIFFSV